MAGAWIGCLFWLLSLRPTEAVAWSCSVETLFLEIPQNSQVHTCAKVPFLKKLQALGLQFY